jgi:cell division protease FtsH
MNRLRIVMGLNEKEQALQVCGEGSHLRPPTAVIFIDEIDALAKCRDGIGRGISFNGAGGNDEREQTLNALLTEMDGFDTPQALSSKVFVIVIAATNRLSIIDPAILRPGRFDRHVEVPPPDGRGRAAILAIHARKVKIDHSVNLEHIANDHFTKGFTGADLKNVINEAALFAVRSRSSSVQEQHLISALRKVKAMKHE